MTAFPARKNRIGRELRVAMAGMSLLLVISSGCVTPWERSTLLKDKHNDISSVQGPTERGLKGMLWDRRKSGNDQEDALLKPILGLEEYEAAEKLYEAEKYVEAEKAFKKIAKAKKFKNSDIREDALFMQAEAAFAQQKYAKAHDRYAQLVKDYPTTRHLDDISQRLFKISMVWLNQPHVADLGEIQRVNYEHYGKNLPPEETAKHSSRQIFVPNFTDKTRPMFDTQGNALAALKLVWTHDPTGPLADDALMLAASYYSRSGNFIEADRHFTLLREQFPDSPHVEKAFELGGHVKLMSYQGSSYDGKTLNDSKQLKLATLRLYPDMDHKEIIEEELLKIEAAEADRLWALVLYYEGKRLKKAAATYCHLLIATYPRSPLANQAKDKLEQYGPGYVDGRALMNSYPDPPRTLWNAIFPPDDHGGIPVPPPSATAANPQTSTLQRLTPRMPSLRPVRKEEPAPQAASTSEDSTEPNTESEPVSKPRRLLPPRRLPAGNDRDVAPAPVGRSSLGGESEANDVTGAGHTRL